MAKKRRIKRAIRLRDKKARGWSCYWQHPWGHVFDDRDVKQNDLHQRCVIKSTSGERCRGVRWVGGF